MPTCFTTGCNFYEYAGNFRLTLGVNNRITVPTVLSIIYGLVQGVKYVLINLTNI